MSVVASVCVFYSFQQKKVNDSDGALPAVQLVTTVSFIAYRHLRMGQFLSSVEDEHEPEGTLLHSFTLCVESYL